MTEHIRDERVGPVQLALYRTTNATHTTMRSCHKRPYVLEVTGQRIRRYSRYGTAMQAYENARREARREVRI